MDWKSKIPKSLLWELVLSSEYGLLIMYKSVKNTQLFSGWEEITAAPRDRDEDQDGDLNEDLDTKCLLTYVYLLQDLLYKVINLCFS